jgi:hypothetical protein
MLRRFRRRFGISGWVAVAAVVFAMTGGAFAAGGIIKITSTKQISPKVLKALAGKRGPAGPTGQAGPAGPAGVTGPQGPAGNKGEAGANGKDGVSVASKEFTGASGGCTAGGIELTAASGATRVCNGKDGTTGFTEALPAGQSERGTWAESALPAKVNEFVAVLRMPISFSIPLAAPVKAHVIARGTPEGSDPVGCSGTVEHPQAESGNLCVFVAFESNVAVNEETSAPEFLVLAPEVPGEENVGGKAGALIQARAAVKTEGVVADGDWVVTG